MIIIICIYYTFNVENPIRGYLTRIIKLNTKLETIKQANLIVIDEMSMMTNIILCVIEQCLKQYFKMLLILLI
jgi:hypothetical protein